MSPLQQAELFFKAGNYQLAQDELGKIKKGSVERDLLLGKCALKMRNPAMAVLAFSQVLDKDPKHVYAASQLASTYVSTRQLDKAAEVYRKTLKRVDDAKLLCEFGVVLWSMGKQDEGYAAVDKVVKRDPGFHEAREQRVAMLMTLRSYEKAIEDLRILVEKFPGKADHFFALGTAEFEVGDFQAAAASLRRAVELKPADGVLLKSLTIAGLMAGDFDQSFEAFRRLKEVDKQKWFEIVSLTEVGKHVRDEDDLDLRFVFLAVVFAEQEKCNWIRREKFYEAFRDILKQGDRINVAPIAHYAGIVDFSNAERLAIMRNAGKSASRGVKPYQSTVSGGDKLRLGYILPHMGFHVVTNIVKDLIAAHDSSSVAVHVFSSNQSSRDYDSGAAQRFQAIPGLFYQDLTSFSDADAAAIVHEKQLDILVDLAVYNDNGRPGIMAHRPAAIQVNFLGTPYSSGADWMDYIISDDVVAPQDAWCSEAEVRMPECYFTYGHQGAEPPQVPERSRFGLDAQDFLFSAMNNSYKIDPEAFATWMRILQATPGSKLLLKASAGAAKNLQDEAGRHGVASERLIFLPPLLQDSEFLLRQGMPDVFLDTRVYGAHTTMAESLWMGVPGISCPGQSFQSRVGSSLLASCGLNELIARDWQDYEALAVSLFHDRERLQRVREHLRQSRLSAAPFDMQGQARALEKAYRHMVQRRVAGLPCESFRVADL